ncbi:MAG: hypothetical protein ACI4EX_00595 [Lachnospiraceae bacterium]
MEYFILVSFHEEERAAKKRRKGPFLYCVERKDRKIEKGLYLIRLAVCLPKYYLETEPMTPQQRMCYFEGLHLPREGPFCHYLMEPEAPLSDEWGRLLVKNAKIRPSAMIILTEEGRNPKEWIAASARYVHDFYLVTEKPEEIEELREELAEEFGIPIQVTNSVKKINPLGGQTTLLIAGQNRYDLSPAFLARVDYFLPLCRREMENMVKRVDFMRCLDICDLLKS